MFKLRPLAPGIGSEVSEIDLAGPLSDEIIAALRRIWLDRTVLLFRGQELAPPQQIAFAERLGEVVYYNLSANALKSHPQVLVLSNVHEDNRPVGTPASGRYWHSDGHYREVPPGASFLYAVEVPRAGGETQFANMVLAYESLADGLKGRIDGRQIVVDQAFARDYHYPRPLKPEATEAQRVRWQSAVQPLVRTHPETGRRALYVGGGAPWRIVGMSDAEGAPLITYLQNLATLPQFTYTHSWQPGDAILWDNRSTIHRASLYDPSERRRMHRVTIAGDRPYFTPGLGPVWQ